MIISQVSYRTNGPLVLVCNIRKQVKLERAIIWRTSQIVHILGMAELFTLKIVFTNSKTFFVCVV